MSMMDNYMYIFLNGALVFSLYITFNYIYIYIYIYIFGSGWVLRRL